jgi:hypothetical protein
LLEKKGERTESLTRKLKKEGQSMTVESWLDQAVDRVRLPFDRVRIVCQDEDIISPELPPEPEREKPIKVKKARKSNLGPKGPSSNRKKKKVSEEGQGVSEPTKSVKLKFKIPKPNGNVHDGKETPVVRVREKQVDSDGDTVGGWSEDDPEPDASPRSSSLTSMSITPPRRLAPQMQQGPSDQVDPLVVLSTGFIRPEMMHQTSALLNLDGHSDQSSVLLSDSVSSDPGSSTPPPVLDEISAKKRKKPPPAANIIRLSKRIVHPPAPRPNIVRSPMESAKSNNGNANSAYQGALDLHDPMDPDAHQLPPSSPDPLLMDTDHDDNGNDLFFNGQIANRNSLPPPYTHSPPPRLTDTSVDVDRSGDTENQNGPDSLFPDTPLWYAYNQHNRLSARSAEGGE